MPQTGMALETWSNLWGRTCNPYNANLGSGGSSGGDGVLVAMRGVPCAPLTSDIGGSIRAPAAFNGSVWHQADRQIEYQSLAYSQQLLDSCRLRFQSDQIVIVWPDLKLLVKLILTHPTLPYEPTCIPGSWVDIEDNGQEAEDWCDVVRWCGGSASSNPKSIEGDSGKASRGWP